MSIRTEISPDHPAVARFDDAAVPSSDLDALLDLVNGLGAAVDGEVMSRSRVVDALLDLRLLATERDDLVERIDEALRSVPGVTATPADWWSSRLDQLRSELAARRPPTDTARTP